MADEKAAAGSDNNESDSDDSDGRNLTLWLLVKGCASPSRNIDYEQRKDRRGNYVNGMKYDFATMQRVIEENAGDMLYNSVENIRSLKRKTVIDEIKAFAKYASNDDDCGHIHIYYTGHGEKHTGNWCFSDGVVSLKNVLDAIKATNYGKSGIGIFSDCCYAGNWNLELKKYRGEGWYIGLHSGSYPETVAFDSKNGGEFTRFMSLYYDENKPLDAPGMDKMKIHWCRTDLADDEYSVKYRQGRRKVF